MLEVDLKSLHCLIVDDDQSFRILFETMLHRLEIDKVTCGRSGSDALSILRNLARPVDIIMCDISMENGSGLELLRTIRMGEAKTVKPDICFVMVTASATPQLVNVAAALDVNGYVVKPFSVNTLRSAIIKACHKSFVADAKRYADVMLPSSEK